jgi:hypothetical protein
MNPHDYSAELRASRELAVERFLRHQRALGQEPFSADDIYLALRGCCPIAGTNGEASVTASTAAGMRIHANRTPAGWLVVGWAPDGAERIRHTVTGAETLRELVRAVEQHFAGAQA